MIDGAARSPARLPVHARARAPCRVRPPVRRPQGGAAPARSARRCEAAGGHVSARALADLAHHFAAAAAYRWSRAGGRVQPPRRAGRRIGRPRIRRGCADARDGARSWGSRTLAGAPRCCSSWAWPDTRPAAALEARAGTGRLPRRSAASSGTPSCWRAPRPGYEEATLATRNGAGRGRAAGGGHGQRWASSESELSVEPARRPGARSRRTGRARARCDRARERDRAGPAPRRPGRAGDGARALLLVARRDPHRGDPRDAGRGARARRGAGRHGAPGGSDVRGESPAFVAMADIPAARGEVAHRSGGWQRSRRQPFNLHVAEHYDGAIALADGKLDGGRGHGGSARSADGAHC